MAVEAAVEAEPGAARQNTVMLPAGRVWHGAHSLPSTVTMKPFCNIAVNDSRKKVTEKINSNGEQLLQGGSVGLSF